VRVCRCERSQNSFKANSTLTTTIYIYIYIKIPHTATANAFNYFSCNPHTRRTRAGGKSFSRLQRSVGGVLSSIVDLQMRVLRTEEIKDGGGSVVLVKMNIGQPTHPSSFHKMLSQFCRRLGDSRISALRGRKSNRVVACCRAACAFMGRKRKCVCPMIVCVCAYL